MSNSGDVAQLYKNLIEEVIKTVRTDFINMGVDEQVLNDLQALWEQKLLEASVFNPQDFPLTASREYAQAGFFYPAPGVSVTTLPMAGLPNMTAARPYAGVPYYAPSRPVVSAVVQMPQAAAAVGVRPAIVPLVPSSVASSQTLTASSQRPVPQEGHNMNNGNSNTNNDNTTGGNRQQAPSKDTIPQFDGAGDSHDEDEEVDEGGDEEKVKDDDEGTGKTEETEDTEEDIESQGPESKRTRNEAPFVAPNSVIMNGGIRAAPIIQASITTNSAVLGGGDELGSDLDDEEEGDEAADDENINDLVLCQYEKISRVRTRWRGILRSGIVHISNRDYCFSKANMDFEW